MQMPAKRDFFSPFLTLLHGKLGRSYSCHNHAQWVLSAIETVSLAGGRGGFD
jgi:hypothetical protein